MAHTDYLVLLHHRCYGFFFVNDFIVWVSEYEIMSAEYTLRPDPLVMPLSSRCHCSKKLRMCALHFFLLSFNAWAAEFLLFDSAIQNAIISASFIIALCIVYWKKILFSLFEWPIQE